MPTSTKKKTSKTSTLRRKVGNAIAEMRKGVKPRKASKSRKSR